MKPQKNERFVCTEYTSLGLANRCEVLVDRRTGVNYLYVMSGHSGGLTPLLDAEGRPIVTSVPCEE